MVVGDKKMAVFDDTLPEGKLQIHDKGVEWVNRRPVARKNKAQIVPIESDEPLKAECAHFLECIESDRTPKTDGNNGIQVLKILNACQESLENKGTIVSLNGNGLSEDFFAHHTAIIDMPCQIGKRTRIWHFSHIMSGTEIGERCNIGQNVVISSGAKVGHNVKIQNNVSVYKGVTLEDDVYCGPSMVFTNVINPRSHIPRKHEFKKTLIKKGATIGANATIVCGNTIGKHAFIGAGAVVTKDVPDYALMLGNPAEVAGWMCECGYQLAFQVDFATCNDCGKPYGQTSEGIVKFQDEYVHQQAAGSE